LLELFVSAAMDSFRSHSNRDMIDRNSVRGPLSISSHSRPFHTPPSRKAMCLNIEMIAGPKDPMLRADLSLEEQQTAPLMHILIANARATRQQRKGVLDTFGDSRCHALCRRMNTGHERLEVLATSAHVAGLREDLNLKMTLDSRARVSPQDPKPTTSPVVFITWSCFADPKDMFS
jgi:hypothetical protein